MHDPNPLVNGKGIKKLQEAGLEVIVGCLEKEAQKINESYSKYITTGIPFVTAKVAVSLDGKIATSKGLSQWITNEASRKFSHELRYQADAILVGKKTIIHDNPELNVRKNSKVVKNPFRIILDTDLSLPLSSSVVQNNSDQKTLIATGSQNNQSKTEKLKKQGVKIIYLPSQNGKVSLQALLQKLGKMQITSILVEGGSETLTSFLKEKLIDKFYCFLAPKIIGQEGISSFGNLGIADLQAAYNLQQVDIKKLDNNVVISGYPKK